MSNYAIILAGGVGSRFWPLSRSVEPKQFLNICSNRPMLDETVRRIKPVIKGESIYIATGAAHRQKIKNCLRGSGIPGRNLFFEPEGKNTLAPIAVLARRILARDPQAVIGVFPSDHSIADNRGFAQSLKKALIIAAGGRIVTFGFRPKRPETGYGYIKAKTGRKEFSPAYPVDRFVEKPDLATAKKFLRDKHYYWNGGIFVFRAATLLDEVKSFVPRLYSLLEKSAAGTGIDRIWHKFPAVSIDYGVMEKTRKAVVLPVDYGWMDMGSWEAVMEVMEKDRQNNIFHGQCIDVGSRNTLAWSEGRLLATVGLEGIIVVESKDAVLVCRHDQTQDVRKVVALLKTKKFKGQI